MVFVSVLKRVKMDFGNTNYMVCIYIYVDEWSGKRERALIIQFMVEYFMADSASLLYYIYVYNQTPFFTPENLLSCVGSSRCLLSMCNVCGAVVVAATAAYTKYKYINKMTRAQWK